LEITVPAEFPKLLPTARETGGKIPRDGKHHVNDDKSLCLGSPLRLRLKVSGKPTLSGFAESCLVPYLYAVSYKLQNGVEFPFGELSHGEAGIIEDYMEMFGLNRNPRCTTRWNCWEPEGELQTSSLAHAIADNDSEDVVSIERLTVIESWKADRGLIPIERGLAQACSIDASRHGDLMNGFRFNEKYLSQIPALQLLIRLGFTYLPPDQVLAQRQGKQGNVLLEGILREQLKRLNRINFKGREFLFSEENIQTAIQKLKNIKYDGLLKTNEAVYDLITLGTALEQSIEGDSKSFNLNYINWREWDRNVFHVTAEFSVDRSRSTESARPDIVLFVNGIPLTVIECKSPSVGVDQAVSQSIRNQHDDYIPKLFVYTQLVMGVNKNAAQYATTGTPAKFWGLWKELRDKESDVERAVNTPLTQTQKEQLFSGDFSVARSFFDAHETEGKRLVTEQDKALYSLCRPERLLELSYKFTLFDGGIKKIARYQQYFVVRSTMERIKKLDSAGRRQGGIIWHTQGSGKSLTMVMLARNLALDPFVSNPRIVLVTDRDDLDKQLGNTFAACGLDPNRATSGRHLMELVAEQNATIVTTLIHKFDKALGHRSIRMNRLTSSC